MTQFIWHEELQPYQSKICKFLCDICGFATAEKETVDKHIQAVHEESTLNAM